MSNLNYVSHKCIPIKLLKLYLKDKLYLKFLFNNYKYNLIVNYYAQYKKALIKYKVRYIYIIRHRIQFLLFFSYIKNFILIPMILTTYKYFKAKYYIYIRILHILNLINTLNLLTAYLKYNIIYSNFIYFFYKHFLVAYSFYLNDTMNKYIYKTLSYKHALLHSRLRIFTNSKNSVNFGSSLMYNKLVLYTFPIYYLYYKPILKNF